jgi:hypothetical protein
MATVIKPDVVHKPQNDMMDSFRTGMQLGQQLQQRKMMEHQQGLDMFNAFKQIAESDETAGGWHALLKDPKISQGVGAALNKMGVPQNQIGGVMEGLSNMTPSARASQEMIAGMMPYLQKGEKPTQEFYSAFEGKKPQETPLNFSGDITGTTYSYQEQQTEQEGAIPTQQQQETATVKQTQQPDLATGESPYTQKLQQMGYNPQIHGSESQFMDQIKHDVPEKYEKLMGVSVQIPTGQIPAEQKKEMVTKGSWIVKEKNATVGAVDNGRFIPNKNFVWTNETKMLDGLAKQTWGESKPDTEAFKNMIYENAKKEGYKGSKEKFFTLEKPPAKPGYKNLTAIPQWYSWAKEKGLKIDQPQDTPTTDALKFSGVSDSRVNAIKNVEKNIGELVSEKKVSYATGKREEYTKEHVAGYLTYDEAMLNHMDRYLGHWGTLMTKDEKTYNAQMQHMHRVYQNLGGEKIMDIVSPNEMELKKAELGGQLKMMNHQMANMDEKMRMGWTELALKGKELDFEMARTMALAEMQQTQNTTDFTETMMDRAFDFIKLGQANNSKGVNADKLYRTSPEYAAGINMLLQVEAIRSGQDPNAVMSQFKKYEKQDPTGLGVFLKQISDSLGTFFNKEKPLGVPRLGITELLQQSQLSPEEQQKQADQLKADQDAAEALRQQMLQGR